MKTVIAILALFWCGIALGQQPLDPRSNSNVTPLSAYVLNSPHLPDVAAQGIPYPDIERMNAGESYYNLQTCRTSFSSTLGNMYGSATSSTTGTGWVPDGKRAGVQLMWTMTALAGWQSTAGGLAGTDCNDARAGNPGPPPYDLYYDTSNTSTGAVSTRISFPESCKAVTYNATTGKFNDGTPGVWTDTPSGQYGDCILQEVITAIMEKTCHVHAGDTLPKLGCDVRYFEGFNEANVAQAWGQTGGSLKGLASAEIDTFNIIHKYCADCHFFVGDASCGGSAFGRTCDIFIRDLLVAWNAVDIFRHGTTTLIPDGISIHPYNERQGIHPTPMPESTVSGDGTGGSTGNGGFNEAGQPGAQQCPDGAHASTSFPYGPKNVFCPYSVLNAFATNRKMLNAISWLPAGLPIVGTESGPYFNDSEWDTTHTDPLTGQVYTDTLERSYIMREALVVGDTQNPLFGTGGGPIFNNWYQFDNTSYACFGTEYLASGYAGGFTSANQKCYTGSPSTFRFNQPQGLNGYGVGHKTVSSWLNLVDHFTTHVGDIFGANTGWNEVWSGTAAVKAANQAVYGTSVQFLWDTGWERNQTKTTSYTKYMDGRGNVHTVTGGSVTFGPEPIMLFGLPAGGVGNPQPNPGSLTTGTVTATSTVVTTLPANFMGLFYSKVWMTYGTPSGAVAFFNTANARSLGSFSHVGPGVLRLGTNESIVWTPGGAGGTANQLAPADVNAFAAFVRSAGYKVIYGLNYSNNSTDVAEATYVSSALGSNLLAWEIGNEPDGLGITPTTFATNWHTIATAVAAAVPGVPFSGPAIGIPTNVPSWVGPFMSTNSSLANLMTFHFYIDNGAVGTTTELLENQSANTFFTAGTSGMTTLQATYPVPWRIAETNNFYNGGAANISNAYGSALYALDYMLTAAQLGASGVNFSAGLSGGNGSNSYTPISDSLGTTFGPLPEYYGLYMFKLATGGQGGPMLSTTLLASGVSLANAYTIVNPTGTYSTVIVNKDQTHNLALTLTLPATMTAANIYQMTDSAGISDKTITNMLIQGAAFDQTLKDGSISMAAPYTGTIIAGTTLVYVPAASAVVVQSTAPSFVPPVTFAISGYHPHGRRQHHPFSY